MKAAKAINSLVLGGFLVSFGVFLKVAPRKGFWPGLAGMLICFGVTVIGTALAARSSWFTKSHFDNVGKTARDPISDGLRGAAEGASGGFPDLWGSVPFDSAILLTVFALIIIVFSLSYDAINRKAEASDQNVNGKSDR